MDKLTAKEIAENLKVKKRIVQLWIQNGLFPNAYKETVEPFGEIWYVPATDLKDFQQPRRGRPKDDNPSPAAIAKRNSRAQEKKAA